MKKDGFSEGTVGAVQTFFFRASDGPWTMDRLAELASVDTVIHLSRGMADRKIYPCVDPRTSRSRLLETKAVGDDHVMIADRANQALTSLLDPALAKTADPLAYLGRLGRVERGKWLISFDRTLEGLHYAGDDGAI